MIALQVNTFFQRLIYAQLSMRESRISPITAVESCPCNSEIENKGPIEEKQNRYALNVASITLISVAVVSRPVNAHQSFTTSPAPNTSDPRLTVPA